MSIEPRITMITLGVADVAAATAFYQRLGFRRSSASNDDVTFFHMNGTVLGLFGRDALAADAGRERVRPSSAASAPSQGRSCARCPAPAASTARG